MNDQNDLHEERLISSLEEILQKMPDMADECNAVVDKSKLLGRVSTLQQVLCELEIEQDQLRELERVEYDVLKSQSELRRSETPFEVCDSSFADDGENYREVLADLLVVDERLKKLCLEDFESENTCSFVPQPVVGSSDKSLCDFPTVEQLDEEIRNLLCIEELVINQ